MLAFGTQIQSLKFGSTCPVEEIESGSLVYNPVADTYLVVSDVLQKQVIPDTLQGVLRNSYQPVRIPAGRLGAGVPNRDLFVTEFQALLQFKAANGLTRRRAELCDTTAAQLCREGLAARDMARKALPITYFALLFVGGGVFLANGALVSGYDSRRFDLEAIPLHGSKSKQAAARYEDGFHP
jgi:Hint domain